MKKLIFILLFFTVFNVLKGQAHVDTVATLAQIEKSGNNAQKVSLLNDLASFYLNNDIKKSEKYASQALELAKSINDTLGIANSDYSLGCVFLYTYYDLSFELILKAYEVYKNQTDTLKIGKCYTIFGIIKSNMKEYETALDYYTKALDMFVLKKDTLYIASALNNIGTCYGDLKNHQKAVEYFEQALKLNEARNNQLYLSINYSNLGQAYSAQNNFTKAKYYLHKSWLLKNKLNDLNGLAAIFGILGNINFLNNQQDSALFFFTKSMQLSIEQRNYKLQESATSSISDIYKNKDQIDSAFVWLEKLLVIRDSISRIEKNNNLNMMEMRLRYEDLLKSMTIKHHEKVFYLSVTIYLLTLSVLIAITIIIVLNLRKKRIRLLNEKISNEKKLLNELVDLKNREISSNMLNLASKNELIKKITGKLNSEMGNMDGSDKVNLQSVISELNSNINKNIWKEFELRFNQVHPDFYTNLLRDFSNLTPNELKLCAFLRSNMTSKEISTITHQNIDSIEKARIRLRKKLNINDTGTNISFFLSKF
jgi:tetratricopeptide (TPR) repeat protein